MIKDGGVEWMSKVRLKIFFMIKISGESQHLLHKVFVLVVATFLFYNHAAVHTHINFVICESCDHFSA